ncbi:hypothetical protein DL98DRAFT_564657 [Cadophora sp. DSE1049]|nr:hypothetical protein DL98DRAFT_564657 [Cadophora sp. DSE1049]
MSELLSKAGPPPTYEIAPRSGTAFFLKQGQRLTVIDPTGGQVSDLLAFNQHDIREVLSNGRTLDYASHLFLTTVMLRIIEDTCGRHDFLFTPCSKDTFRIQYGDKNPLPGCFGHLATAFKEFKIEEDQIAVPFNCFMNVAIDGETGKLTIQLLKSKAGDHVDFVAEMDLIVRLTACSASKTNGGSYKPIHYRISWTEQSSYYNTSL